MTEINERPLRGYTVAVTADRRRAELAALLERRGANVLCAQAVQLVSVADDELLAATQACLDGTVDLLVVTTAIGLRGWFDAADGWGLGDALRSRLREAEVLARGPKARGAVRAVGLHDGWSPPSETVDGVMNHLLTQDLRGRRIVVQLHGEPLTSEIDALRSGGANVIAVPVYTWEPPAHGAPARQLVERSIGRQVDAIAFTSAPAVDGLLNIARAGGREDALLDAFRIDVVPFCIGSVCAAPLEKKGVSPVRPARARLGDLVRSLVEEVPVRRSMTLSVAGHQLEIRGQLVVVDHRRVELPPASMAMLRALAHQPGRVFGRDELAGKLPGRASSGHAVEMAVTRLRALLGDPRLVHTVVKRGYRLPV